LTDTPPEAPRSSLDDVDDDALLARLKRLPGFADLLTPPSAPAPVAPAKEDGVMQKILGALEKLDKSTPAPAPSPAPSPTPPQATEPVLSKVASWFWDE
jgi:hypothetical protein